MAPLVGSGGAQVAAPSLGRWSGERPRKQEIKRRKIVNNKSGFSFCEQFHQCILLLDFGPGNDESLA